MKPSGTPGDHESGRPATTGSDGREARLLLMRQLIHDLNNALSVVSINVALLAHGALAEREAADLLEEIAQACARASTHTGQLRRCVSESSNPFRTDGGSDAQASGF